MDRLGITSAPGQDRYKRIKSGVWVLSDILVQSIGWAT